MKTSKPFATITYNTNAYLIDKLEEIRNKGAISFWAFISHRPEENEKKEHKHLYISPERQIDTKNFMDYFTEIDLDKPLQPLKMMPCRPSKWADWYLYAIHDVKYLQTKDQTRDFQYDMSDIVTSNRDYLLELVNTIDRSRFDKNARIIEKFKQGASLLELIESGEIPISQFNQYKNLYDYVKVLNHKIERMNYITAQRISQDININVEKEEQQ